MNKRPSRNDSEKEILRMQREFLAEKRKNKELQPAAKFVRLTKEGNDQPEIDTRSAFAKSRNISKSKSEKKTEGIIIGEIVERKFDCYSDDDSFNKIEETSSDPFPKPVKLNLSSMTDEDSASSVQKTSLFGKTFKTKRNVNTEMKTSLKVNLGNKSALIEGAEAEDIHRENVKKLESLSEEQIIKEREELLKKLDPSLIEFLKSKRNQTTYKENSVRKMTDEQKSTVKMDVDPGSSNSVLNTSSAIPIVEQITKNAQNWLHFDVLEPEKLEWTKDIEKNIQELKPGESFEARFDWKGVLLPYSDGTNSTNDNRELYLHGDEAHRPGYTLQELFRLARANVLQQRVSALNAIAGILNIYNQGFYDGVLDLPISKIFFFLRFAMDENTPAIIEASSRALAYLFYNDTDEVLLDTIYEASNGMHQPALEKINSAENNEGDPLEDAFSEMNLNTDQNQKGLFSSTIEDEEFEKEKESINDFHLAETDLMECLLRTNILERIRYILITVKPEQTTVSACVKILIRIARTNREMAMKIVMLDTLIKCLIQNYLRRMENAVKQLPDPLIMKLFRILASYDIGICVRLREHGVLDIAKSYIFSRQDINTRLIQMQIETFRFIRLYLTLLPDEKLYTDLLPALRYMLEWHYQNLVFEENGPFIVKQHASAVLNLLLCGEISCCYPIFVDILEISLCKWFNSAARNGLQEFSQKLLLSTCLNVCGEFMGREPGPFLTFIDNYLRLFLESNTFKMLTEELSLRSSLLTSQKDRSNIYSPLPNLGAIIVRNKQNAPTLIFSKNFPSFLIHSLVTFCHKLSFVSDTNARQQQINSLLFNNDIKTFVNNVIQHLNHKIHTNWFIKTEIMLLLSIINSAKLNRNLIDTRNILGLSLQLLTCLSQEMTISLISLLDDVVFNIDYYDCVTKLVTKEQLKEWRSIYVDSIISSLKPSKLSGKSLTVFEWKTAILVKSWPYHLLAIFLNMLEASPNDQDKLRKVIPEKQIIHTVMPFTDQLEASGMNLVSSTEMLMYLMTAYLGPDSKFLEPDTKQLLKEKADKLRQSSVTFNLNLKLESRKSFESLYSVFLDTFQGNSYGDEGFSALIMIPLAQKYDIKWRKRVWSEHIAALRFITCTEQMLFDGIEAYLSPPETDLSLLKCYHQAINNNLLRNGSVPFIIAEYHLNRFNERRQTKN